MSVNLTTITINAFENVNLFDAYSSNIVLDNLLSPTTGNLIPSAGSFVSDYIAVSEGQQIYFYSNVYGCRFVSAFNASKQNISGSGVTTAINAGGFYTVPAGIFFIKFSSYLEYIDGTVVSASAISDFRPFGLFESKDYFTKSYEKTRFYGRSFISYGDSITAQGLWQGQIARVLGVPHTAYGIGGSTVTGASGSTTAMCQDARINALPASADLVLVMGGTNDWAQSVAIGTVYDIDPAASFYGGLNKLLTALSTKYPRKKVIMLAPIWGELPSTYVAKGWTNQRQNLNGNTIRDYADAVIRASAIYGIPVIDVGGNCRINTSNILKYLKDDGDRIHPNNIGGQNMAACITRELYKFAMELTLA